jgi:predicted RNA-binding Zn-ribbon protein involved in translation (DUF1610 family)
MPVKIDGWTVHASVTPERVLKACERHLTSLDDLGFCIACGEEAMGVEPDATEYECESCGELAVYGADELLIHMVI